MNSRLSNRLIQIFKSFDNIVDQSSYTLLDQRGNNVHHTHD